MPISRADIWVVLLKLFAHLPHFTHAGCESQQCAQGSCDGRRVEMPVNPIASQASKNYGYCEEDAHIGDAGTFPPISG
jgi:hypothetical protein